MENQGEWEHSLSTVAFLTKSLSMEGFKKKEEIDMKALFIISTDDAETAYNALRLANVAVKKGDEVSVFMLGRGVLYEQSNREPYNVVEQVNRFEGDFYVWGVCLKSHGLEGSSACPIGWMDDLYELSREAEKVYTF